MPRAFCPGHITCLFSPGSTAGDMRSRGSRGIGIRVSKGAAVKLTEVSGKDVTITIDGEVSDAPVTRYVLQSILPGRGLEAEVVNGLPVGQGFGMSAAGAIAAALCAAEMSGVPADEAWSIAHASEIVNGGGLGDVSALRCCSDVPERVSEGLPPAGEVRGTGLRFPVLTVAVLGRKMYTGHVLSKPSVRSGLVSSYEGARKLFTGSRPSLFEASNKFSSEAGVESREVAEAISRLKSGNRRAAMCMLGNSIFSDAPYLMVKDAFPDADVRPLMSTSEPARLL